MRSETRTVVCKVEELPPGEVKIVDVGRFGVGVYNLGGEYYALVNYCLHRGAPVCRGKTAGVAEARPGTREVLWSREGEIVRCPWHGWEFDIKTGRAVAFANRRVRSYEAAVEDGEVVIYV